MKNYNVSINNVLPIIAEAMLPLFSGQEKILEIVVRTFYQTSSWSFAKVIFWCPNDCIFIACKHEYGTKLSDISDCNLIIKPISLDRLKLVGINIFKNNVMCSHDTDMLQCKIVEIRNPTITNITETLSTFSFERIKLT